MHSQSVHPAPDVSVWGDPEILKITLRQLREWEALPTEHLLIEPKPAEQCWEDTELDVRRVAL